ncbi:MAG TPA: mannose-1-phosphate guanyltransferase [Kosmotogaceae bacterium]|nr:mannose-1-phosphate guanyltransferase [Kosmotogaceae bacterium]
MKAMILAAGAGTRLRPLTEYCPKPMLPIVDRPVIDFLLELLKKYRVSQLMINISHLGWKIQDYVRDGSRYGLNVGYSFEGYFDSGELVTEPIGSAGGLKRIQDFSGFFDETFVVLCGDAIVDMDLNSVISIHKERGAIATIAATHVPLENVSNYGVILCKDDGRVVSFQEKPAQKEAKSTLVNTGIYFFEPEVFDYIPSGSFYDIGSQLIPDLVSRGKTVVAAKTDISWFDIGRTTDYLEVLGTALERGIPGFHPGGVEISEGVFVGAGASIEPHVEIEPPVYIGGSCKIGRNSVIKGPSILGANSVVGEGCEVVSSTIIDYTRISSHTSVRDLLISPDFVLDREGIPVSLENSKLYGKISDARKH